MAGLLSEKVAGRMGLLSMLPMKRGLLAPDQAMQAQAQEQTRQRQALLAPQTDAPRERVSGWRLLDRVLGGETITEGLDSERTRLQAEANRPAQNARMQAIAATIQDPRELALFNASPEDWAKNVGQQFAPQVVSPGSIQAIGGRAAVGAPATYEFGDTRQRFDPLTGRTETVATRGPTYDEQNDATTAEASILTARRPITLNPGETAFTLDGRTVASGAPRVFSASEGSDLVTDSGAQLYSNDRAPDPNANQASQATVRSLETDVFPVLDRQEQLLRSGNVIAGLGGDVRLQAARAQAALGDANAQRQVAATEEYIANAGRLRVGMARSLGANPSNADIQLLETVTAGNINTSPDGLLATIAQGRALAERQRSAAQSASGAAPAGGQQRRLSPEEAARLPSGTPFIGLDGVPRVRQ